MACAQTLHGLAVDCESSLGGVAKILIAPYSAGTISRAVDTGGTETGKATLSGITTATTSAETTYRAFYFRKGAASVSSTLNVDVANGVNYVSSEIALTFTRQDTPKRIEMSALALGEVQVLYLDSNGKAWAIGIDNSVAATAGQGQTGQAKGDGNNYSITLTGEDLTFPYELDETGTNFVKNFGFPQ